MHVSRSVWNLPLIWVTDDVASGNSTPSCFLLKKLFSRLYKYNSYVGRAWPERWESVGTALPARGFPLRKENVSMLFYVAIYSNQIF